MTMDEMKALAASTVDTALEAGAETAEIMVMEGTDFEVSVRKGGIETLNESVSSRIAIAISRDGRRASVTSSDLTTDSIDRLVREAVELADVMDKDEFFCMPDKDELGEVEDDLCIFDPSTVEISTDKKIKTALELEKTACDMDKRIIPDEAACASGVHSMAFANSLGFCSSYSRSMNSISLSCTAEDNKASGLNTGKKQSSHWYSMATSFDGLEPIEKVASEAVSRTLRKLGSVKPKTCEIPVVFDAFTARDILASIAAAVSGSNIYRNNSFLVGKTGSRIGAPLITIIDDPLLTGKLGSRPFDGEGVRSRRNTVVEKGILKKFLMSSYEAKKLDSRSTGNAGGHSNFYIVPGEDDPEKIIGDIKDGLCLTALFGPGANWTTGDFSQGGQGIWIENGELSYPVDGFTVAGSFQKMLNGIEAVGNDIDWKNRITSPTLKISSMTVSGT